MFTQQQLSQARQKFWISFGKYMLPIPSSEGEKINWVNYRTGIKLVQFKMDVTEQAAYIAIEISGNDFSNQQLYFNHFKTFKKPLEELLEEKWHWELSEYSDGSQPVARIYAKLENVNIISEGDWPAIITFLKNRMIALDKFWNEYKDIFDMLT